MDFDFENFYFWDFLGSQISRFPDFQFPDFQISRNLACHPAKEKGKPGFQIALIFQWKPIFQIALVSIFMGEKYVQEFAPILNG